MKVKFLTVIGLVMLFTSCSEYLDQKDPTSLTEEEAYSRLDIVEPLVFGMFTSWRDLQKDRGGLYFSLGTDEAQQGAYQVMSDPGQAGLDKYNGFLNQENNSIGGQWNARWPIVNSAALAIRGLSLNTEADAAKRDLLLGEASFIRASVMFELTQYWGEVPVLDKDHTAELGWKRQPLNVVYASIIKDLTVAEAKLPETQSNKSFPTKYLAQALLGKVYLYAPQASGVRDYAKAKEAFGKVIASGKYSLLPSYANNFNYNFANSAESIYEFQFNNNWPDNNQLQWQTGSRAVANISQNSTFGGYDFILPTQYCYKDKTAGGIWEAGDTRKAASIRYDFKYRGKTPVLPAGMGGDELDPHIKKYEDDRIDGTQQFWYSGKNKPYIRYSDVLLCYAECLNELGNTTEAEGIVNQVRQRAFGTLWTPTLAWSGLSQVAFKDQIMDERMRELAFEGWRRMDLIRSGKFVQLIKERNRWAKENGTIAEFHTRYAIPLTEILQNDEINPEDQNPGY